MTAPSHARRPAPVRRVALSGPAEIDAFLDLAGRLLSEGRAPDTLLWREEGAQEPGDLFCREDVPPPLAQAPVAPTVLPSDFAALARRALLHIDPDRHALAYRLLWRLRAKPDLLGVATDPDVARLEALARAVRRDMHKMTAFVRFRRIEDQTGGEEFVAWFEPDHHIVAATAPFFARRFAGMRWTILTPRASARWDGARLLLGPGAARGNAPSGDALEDVWRAYYGAIFNPARLNLKAMAREMPRKYWRNMPEADLIAPLARQAGQRAGDMIAAAPTRPRRASPYTPPDADAAAASAAGSGDLGALATAERGCTNCDLYRHSTQVVPGEGPAQAHIMFVGEQPGDEEDIKGRPFVGPAGRLLDVALERAEIDRAKTFVTNAVKHFKFEPRGKKRIHKKPGAREISACNGWLVREIDLVRPRLIVALGATAATALTGRPTTLREVRGREVDLPSGARMLATVHPSYLLRLIDPEDKKREWRAFLDDLRTARALAEA